MHIARRASRAAVICLLCLACVARAQSAQIQIDFPEQGAEVGRREMVRGTVSDPNAKIFVLVRSVEDRYWWVQRVPAPPGRDGSWETRCYFGSAEEGLGEEFHIVAVVSRGLREEQRFEELPPYTAISETIKVYRRKRE